MAKRIPITPGDIFDRWTVVADAPSRRTANRLRNYVVARCVCGTEREVGCTNLRTGHSRSCGCLSLDTHTTHGMSNSRTYQAWLSMRSRCYGGEKNHKRYRELGLGVFADWCGSFEKFFAHVGECPPGMTLDRIDNNRGYEPGNVRWATWTVQQRNRSNNVWVMFNGERMCLVDACAAAGINYDSAGEYIRRKGFSAQQGFDHFVARAAKEA